MNDDRFAIELSRRLSRLSHAPVDTTSLDRALRPQLPEPPSVAAARSAWRVFRPLMAVAASVLFMAAIFVGLQPRQVQAQTCVRPSAKRQVSIVLPCRVELVRVRKLLRITIGAADHHQCQHASRKH